ncbi:MAG: SufD family Fe-S cluster assembly protein [Nitrososphaerota archaeon]|nr:SufD family Fe-S cluster assembly protein [Nitrososphaerota archaeon]
MTSAQDIVTDDYKTKYGFADSTGYLDSRLKGLTEDVVREISRLRDEPSWMLEFRLRALKAFEARPVPTWGVDLSPIKFQDFYYYAQPAKETAKSWDDVPPEIKKTFEKLGIPEAERKFLAGVGAVYESQEVYNSLQKDLQKQGVIFTSVSSAVKEYPDLIRKYIGTIVPANDNKFAALNSAVWSDGPFIYVPEGVKITMPLQSYFRINAQGMGQFERTLVVAEPDSEVHYIEGCLPADELVSTGQQLVPIESLGSRDAVVSHTGAQAAVTKQFIHTHKGRMLTIVPQSEANAFKLTPEHPVLCVKRDRLPSEKGVSGGRGVLAEGLDSVEPSFVPAGELEVGDFIVYVAPTATVDDHVLSEAVVKILGIYLAEGSISFDAALGTDVMEFSFGPSENDRRLAAELIGLIRSVGETATIDEAHRPGPRVATRSRTLIDLCAAHCGMGPATKVLSEKVIRLPVEKQELLLRYYLGGYGKRGVNDAARPPAARRSTASRLLAFQVQEMLARGGVYASVSVRKASRERIRGRTASRRTQYVVQYPETKRRSRVMRRGNLYLVPIRRIASEEWNDLVYNLEVERDNSYLVRGFAVHNCTAAMYQKSMLHAAIVELVAKKGAKIRYITIQNWSKNVYNLVTKRAHAYEGASVTWLNGEVGSGRNMKYPSIYLLGKGASAEILSMAYAGADQVQDTGGKVIHLASDTSSKIISKSVSKDGGEAIYRGLLHIAKGAHNVKATVRCDALLMDEESKTSTIPYVEVMADDATVTHEASVGKVGEEQIFYLMARGISERDALSMIVNGFVEPFTKELPMTYAIEINRLMALEMTGSVG